eukprot:10926656-Alexandrium_andersonii.AAC.1
MAHPLMAIAECLLVSLEEELGTAADVVFQARHVRFGLVDGVVLLGEHGLHVGQGPGIDLVEDIAEDVLRRALEETPPGLCIDLHCT